MITENEHPGDGEHDRVTLMLPWHVNGSLTEDERAQVDAHLARCVECSRQLVSEQALRTAVRSMSSEADAGWDRLRLQIAPVGKGDSTVVNFPTASRPLEAPQNVARLVNRHVLAVAVQLLLLVAGGATLATMLQRDEFVLLGRAEAQESPTGNLLIMFQPATTQAAMQVLLLENGAQIVRGPTTTGAYVAAVDPAGRAQVVARLRGDATVVMVEAIDQAGPE